MSKLSRRGLVASAAAIPALSLPAIASTSSDEKFRRLWARYVAQVKAEKTAHEEQYLPALASYEAELPPRPEEVWPGEWYAQHSALREKHGVDLAYDAWNEADEAVRATIKEIQRAEAETLFGVGVKLAAVPHLRDPQDSAAAAIATLEDIDRSLGTSFAPNLKGAIGWADHDEDEGHEEEV